MGIPPPLGEGKEPFISSVGIPSDVGKCESSAQRPAPKTYFHISMVRVETRWLCPSEDDWPGLSIPHRADKPKQANLLKFLSVKTPALPAGLRD